jgi:hypothetical protein
MSHRSHQHMQGSASAVGRSLTVTDLCLCLVPIGLFLSIVSLV